MSFLKKNNKKDITVQKLQNDRKSLYNNNYSGLIPELNFLSKRILLILREQ